MASRRLAHSRERGNRPLRTGTRDGGRPRRRRLRDRRRRAGCPVGAVRFGQDHPAPRPGGADEAIERDGRDASRRGAGVRLPGGQPAADVHRARERRLRRSRRRRDSQRQWPFRGGFVEGGGAGGQARRASRRALGRRGAARGDREGPRAASRIGAVRRADRPSRLRHRASRARCHRRPSGTPGIRARHGDPRRRRRLALRAAGRDGRWSSAGARGAMAL